MIKNRLEPELLNNVSLSDYLLKCLIRNRFSCYLRLLLYFGRMNYRSNFWLERMNGFQSFSQVFSK